MAAIIMMMPVTAEMLQRENKTCADGSVNYMHKLRMQLQQLSHKTRRT